MTATSGRTSLELLHKKDRLGAFSKTFMVTLPWVSTKCLLTWKPKATPQGRLLFQLAVSTLPTDETGSGLLHSNSDSQPDVTEHGEQGSWGKDVGNAQHDGSSTAKVGGVNEEDARGSSQGQSQAEQSSGASGREDDGSLRQELADPNGIGRGGGNSAGRGVGERNVQSEEQGRSSVGREAARRGEPRGEDVADPSDKGLQGRLSRRSNSERQSKLGHSGCSSSAYGQSGENWWSVEPDVGRVAHGDTPEGWTDLKD